MTLQQMKDLTLDNIFFTILEQLIDFSAVPANEEKWVTSGEGSLYDTTTLHYSLQKPTLAEMELTFLTYKDQMISDEEGRIEDIESRLMAMEHVDFTIRKVFPDVSNTAIWKKELILNENHSEIEENLSQLEEAHVPILEKATKKSARDIFISQGQKDRRICTEALELVGGHNKSSGLTTAEIMQQMATFSVVKTCLDSAMPISAKEELLKITDSSVDELKQMLIEHFTDNGI